MLVVVVVAVAVLVVLAMVVVTVSISRLRRSLRSFWFLRDCCRVNGNCGGPGW